MSFFAVCVVTACAGHSDRGVADAPSTTQPHVPIFTASWRGEPLPVPVLHSSLRGEPIRIALDTGATRTFVLGPESDFEAGKSPPRGWATDAMGRKIAWVATDPRQLRLAEHSWSPRALVVLEEAALGAVGFDGALAPIDLIADDMEVRIDFPAGRLDLVPAGGSVGSSLGRTCRSGSGHDPGWQYVVDVELEGAAVPMLLDTAWSLSALFSDAGSGDQYRTVDAVAVGGSASLRVLGEAQVEVGGARFAVARMPALRRRDSSCEVRGVLGFDVLSHCVVGLRRDGIVLRCDSRPPPLHWEPPSSGRADDP